MEYPGNPSVHRPENILHFYDTYKLHTVTKKGPLKLKNGKKKLKRKIEKIIHDWYEILLKYGYTLERPVHQKIG